MCLHLYLTTTVNIHVNIIKQHQLTQRWSVCLSLCMCILCTCVCVWRRWWSFMHVCVCVVAIEDSEETQRDDTEWEKTPCTAALQFLTLPRFHSVWRGVVLQQFCVCLRPILHQVRTEISMSCFCLFHHEVFSVSLVAALLSTGSRVLYCGVV